MVYIAPDGTIHEKTPWGLALFSRWFWGILNFFAYFIKTLINPNFSKGASNRSSTDYRPGGQGPPPPPRRRMGGFKTMENIKSCPMPGGG